MKHLRFVVADARSIRPYVPELRQLEQSIRYPIADGADHFFIDHGADYHPFFSELGHARFLLALRGERVIGSIAGVQRTLSISGKPVEALYLCDLKVAPDERGRGLSRQLIQRGLGVVATDKSLRQTRFFYGAAMRGAAGDVMRTARGLHPFRFGNVGARLHLYFVEPEKLAALELSAAPRPPSSPGVELSPSVNGADAFCSTTGRKDLRLVSSQQPWPLVHLPLGPSGWGSSWGAYLQRCGHEMVQQGVAGTACFSIDERLGEQVNWLTSQGVTPGATCTIYSWHLTIRRSSSAWVHLPTSEI